MAFLEERLSTRISFNSTGGPMWATTAVSTYSGARSTDRRWSYPLHSYDIAQALRENADFEAVRALFMVVGGRADGFRYKDWADFRATVEQGVAAAFTASSFQLMRRYATNTRIYDRRIQKPVAGAVAVFRSRGGAMTNITDSAALDSTTGIFVPSGHAAGDEYTWSGDFDVPVAFQDDAMAAQIVNRGADLLLTWPSIKLEEIRL